MLLQLQVTSFPNMDKSNRTKVINSFKNHTKYLEDSSQQVLTLEELARKIVGGA